MILKARTNMDAILRKQLEEHGVDVAKGIEYHMGNEDMYEKILRLVLSDTAFDMLFNATETENAEVIFDVTHSLKGTLGNVGLTELDSLITDICEVTRKGSTEGVRDKVAEVKDIYGTLISYI
jgi:HPt (histidine-containing phosphotransfer) domain-containing protein